MGQTLQERFEYDGWLLDEIIGCFTWGGRYTSKGVATFSRFGGRAEPAHRVAYEIYVGPIPKGEQVIRNCFNMACVNPEHLRLSSEPAEGLAAMSRAELVFEVLKARGRAEAFEANYNRLTAELHGRE